MISSDFKRLSFKSSEFSYDSMTARDFTMILQDFMKTKIVKSSHRLIVTSTMISVDFKGFLIRPLHDFQQDFLSDQPLGWINSRFIASLRHAFPEDENTIKLD